MAWADETTADRIEILIESVEILRGEVTVREAEIQDLQARIDATLALHPCVGTDRGWLPEPVWFCAACHQRWPCASVRALTGEGT